MVNKSLPASRAGFEKPRTREWWGLSFERSADASCEVQRAGIGCRGCVATAAFNSVDLCVGVGLRHQSTNVRNEILRSRRNRGNQYQLFELRSSHQRYAQNSNPTTHVCGAFQIRLSTPVSSY